MLENMATIYYQHMEHMGQPNEGSVVLLDHMLSRDASLDIKLWPDFI